VKIPFRSKFRFDRGPLRAWLLVVGLLTIQFDPARYAIGVVLVILGTALHFASKCCLRQNEALTLSGPYRFVRNPFYLANLIVECGLLAMIGNPWVAAAYLALWFWIYGSTIRSEEATLARLFGEQFAAYCRRVPRLFPMPGRYLRRDEVTGPKFSLRNRNIIKGHEIQRVLRLMSYPLLLLVAAAVSAQRLHFPVEWNALLIIGGAGFVLLNLAGYAVTLVIARQAGLLRQGPARA
jgi:protein-S-isoprenylcysteine O-methyltransferase Ste14